jgi:acetyl esterase
MPLDADAQVMLDLLAQMPEPWTIGAVATRAMMAQSPRPPGEDVDQVRELTIDGPAGTIPARLFRPAGSGAAPLPLVVFFHGGGWVFGGLDSHDGLCRMLANRTGAVVVSVDYRLAPEHPYPAAADDAYAATVWAVDHAAELGADPARVAVAGDSAGGNLAAVVALRARDEGGPELAFQLLVYPVVDFDRERPSTVRNGTGYFLTQDAMRWFDDQYTPDVAHRDHAYAAPLRAGSLAGLPPALVITAEYDPLCDEGAAYADALVAAGVPATLSCYEGVFHGFFSMALAIEKARAAVDEASAALRAALI